MGQWEISVSKSLLPSGFERLGLPKGGLPSKGGFNFQGSPDPLGRCKLLWRQQCWAALLPWEGSSQGFHTERSSRTVVIKHSVLHWYLPGHQQNSGKGEKVKRCFFIPNKSSHSRPGKSGSWFAEQSRQSLWHLWGAGSAAGPDAPGERPHWHRASGTRHSFVCSSLAQKAN